MYRELEAVRTKQGLTPIIAHLDRYIGPFRTHGIPQRLSELPVLVQANAGFFLKSSTASLAMKLLKADLIQLLGSDCHNLTTRPPEMGRAVQRIEEKLGQGTLDRIRDYEHMILDV